MKREVASPVLVRKYNAPVPRYTSYPTVPNWKEGLDAGAWQQHVGRAFAEHNARSGISLYIHLPFCESLCTYCGCNKKITTNHRVEEEYLAALEKEWSLYRRLMKETPVIRELHLGGGTPTFFSPANLQRLMDIIRKNTLLHPRYQFSIEGHPNNTTRAHLRVLHAGGFRRISFGVQDNDPDVQRAINRIQPFENLERATGAAREAGFTSINFDLIYGLPLQTTASITRTFAEVLRLRPDRIAFYSYAHVPWTSPVQRLFDECHLPGPEEKLAIYLRGRELLLEAGYTDIGMDHFALPGEELHEAWKEGRLHRNFMGYTTQSSPLLLGLGVSSISDTGTAYMQNVKSLKEYYRSVDEGLLPVSKGIFLGEEDRRFRRYILDIACAGRTSLLEDDLSLLHRVTFPQLKDLAKDGLVQYSEKEVVVTEAGRDFLRTICSAFDLYLPRAPKTVQFSRAI
jgi:oxygen-independent coproporphyrinogen-3 oxidase